ncbi:MAG: hypothetical protein J0H01_05320 [Rhizobiales bacterium]|nr:hypothetical protein [Hyphomicrobiales bacterium]
MTAINDAAPGLRMRPHWLTQVPVAAWLGLAVLLTAARELHARWSTLPDLLGDTDDAVRLVQVREWLAGKSWFDLHTDRFGLADGLFSHWSRLVDVGIGGLIRLFGWFLPVEQAELAARTVWPLLLLIPLFGLVARAAGWRGGRLAAVLAIAFAATSLAALAQFRPGRIDHHSVMVISVAGAILVAARAYTDRRVAPLAGVLAGFGLAIGYEGLSLVVALMALVTLIALFERGSARIAASITAACAITLALAFLVGVGPTRWFDIACDALALNVVLAAGVGAASVQVMASDRLAGRALARWLVVGAGGLAALAVYAMAQPVCLAGPFAMVDPLVRANWLTQVAETQSLLQLAQTTPRDALTAALTLTSALVAQAWLWRAAPRDTGALLGLAMLALAALLGAWQIKLLPYATVLSCVPLAVFAARLPALAGISAATLRFCFVVLFNQVMLAQVAGAVLGLDSLLRSRPEIAAPADTSVCFDRKAVTALAQLPAGLVAGPIDIGPFIVAFTPHRALAAPYHRLNAALHAQIAIWTSSDMAEAERLLRGVGATYLVECPPLGPSLEKAQGSGQFEARLARGDIPAFLERIPLPAAEPIKVFRLRPANGS